MIKGYYYLHTNSDLIFKTTQPEVESGGFVRKVWSINTEYRATAWLLCIEALALGANKSRVDELVDKWGLTDQDAEIFAERFSIILRKDGNAWMAAFSDFKNKQDSQCGFGTTALEALAELAKPGLELENINDFE